MSGCEVWKLPQRDRDRWDVWALCGFIGGCDQDECTFFEEAEASWPGGESELEEDVHGADPADGDWRF